MTDFFKRLITFALASTIAIQLTPYRANAQAAVAVPVGAVIVVLGGIAYYVWTNSQGAEQRMPVSGDYLEDPEGAEPEIYSDCVAGDSESQALSRCQEVANGGLDVKVKKVGNNRYECTWRSSRG